MTTSRVLVGLIAVIVFCGPLCSIPFAVAARSTEDCHSQPAGEKSSPGTHVCCQAGTVPQANLILPQLPVTCLKTNSDSLQLFANKNEIAVSFTEQNNPRDRLSSITILRI